MYDLLAGGMRAISVSRAASIRLTLWSFLLVTITSLRRGRLHVIGPLADRDLLTLVSVAASQT